MKLYPHWIGLIVAVTLALPAWSQEETPPPAPVPPTEEAAAPVTVEPAPVIPGGPETITEADYQELAANSPFTRALNLSDSLILTGIAKIGSDTIATILNKESKETYVVSGGQANAQGWRLSKVEGDQSALDKVTAKIAVNGGEVVSVRFDEKQLKPGEAKPAAGTGSSENRSDGRREGDGHRGPSPETRAMMEKLTDEQRRELFERVGRLRQENPEMTREQMGERFKQELERAVRKNESRGR